MSRPYLVRLRKLRLLRFFYLGLRHCRLLASGLLVKIFNFDVNFYKKLVASAKVDLGLFGYTLQYNFC